MPIDIATVNLTLNAPATNTVVTMTGPQGAPGVFQSILGTTNQVNVAISGTGGSVATLSLPQSIATTSSPTFAAIIDSASNPASGGVLRIHNAGTINWRNAANSADLALGVDTSNRLTFGGLLVNSTNDITVGPTGSGATYITSGTADQTIINNAITAASSLGGVVRVLAGAYSLTGGIIILPNVSFIIDNVGATVIRLSTSYNWTTYPNPIKAVGSFNGSQINLSADVADGVNVINVTSTSDYVSAAADEMLYLISDAAWEGNGTDTSGRYNGEFVKINTKSTNSFTIYGTTRDAYTTANSARLYRMTWVENIVIRNVQIYQDAALHSIGNANTLLFFSKCRNVEVSNCRLHDFDDAAIQLNDCYAFSIHDNFIYNLTDDTVNNYLGYGVVIAGACELGRITGNSISRVRHGVTTSTGDSSHGIPRNVLIANNTVSHTTNSGLDTHQCGEGVAIINNYISNCQTWGIFTRGRATVIDGNIIEWTGGGISVGISRQNQGGMAASTRVTNNHIRHITHNSYTDIDGTFTQVGAGIVLNESDNLIVKGNVIEYVASNGITVGPFLCNSVIEDNTILNANQLNGATGSGVYFVANLTGTSASITAFSGTTATLTSAAGGFSSTYYWPGQNIVVQGCATSANNGTFVVTAIVNDTTIQYTNATAVAGDANNGSIQFGIGGSTGNIIQDNTVINISSSRTDIDTAGYAKYCFYESGVTGTQSPTSNTANVFKSNTAYGIGTALFNSQNTGNYYSGNSVTESAPIKTVAGVPTDSSFVSTPENGMLALNSTSGAMYVRSGGSWKQFGTTQDGTSINFVVGGVTVADFTTSQLQFSQALTNPAIQQNSTNVASATGAPLVISAQAATGTTSTGGGLYLQSGTGTNATGNVYLRTGSTTQVQISATATSILTTTAATSTSTGCLVLTGGLGVGGAIYGASVFDNSNRVVTALTAGAGISVTGSAPTLTVTNTGVTSIAGTANQITTSASTGAVTLSLPSVVQLGGSNTLSGATVGALSSGALVLDQSFGALGFNTYYNGTNWVGTRTGYGFLLRQDNAGNLVLFTQGAVTSGGICTNSNLFTAAAGVLTINPSTTSSSSTTGALVVTGGLGVGGAVNTGSSLTVAGAVSGVTTLTTSGTITMQTSSVATSGANFSSPLYILGGSVWNGTTAINDTFGIQINYGTGANPVATLTFTHLSGTSGGSQTSLASGNLIIGGGGNLTKINQVVTTGAGVAILQGKADLTAQTANVAATTVLGPTTQAGLYRVSVFISLSQAATTSSTMPDTRIIYTNNDSNTVITQQVTAASTNNTLGTFASADIVINAKAASNIQYDIGQVTAYASSGATAMQFNYHHRLEYLG